MKGRNGPQTLTQLRDDCLGWRGRGTEGGRETKKRAIPLRRAADFCYCGGARHGCGKWGLISGGGPLPPQNMALLLKSAAVKGASERAIGIVKLGRHT